MNSGPLFVSPCHSRLAPVIVFGHARSGTSIASRLLLDHLAINVITDGLFIQHYAARLARYADLSDDRHLRALLDDIGREPLFARLCHTLGFVFDVERTLRATTARTYAGVVRAIVEQFTASRGLERWGVRMQAEVRHLELMRQLFPDAQFLHVVRDGRDVACSLFSTGSGPKNAYEAALEWRRTVEEGRTFRDTLSPGTFAEIRYEELVSDPSRTLGWVARYLGIQNPEALIDSVAVRLRMDVRRDSVLTWKQRLSWREIECFEAFAGDEMAALGYPLQFRRRTTGHSAMEAALWKTQAVWRRLASGRYWSDRLGVVRPGSRISEA